MFFLIFFHYIIPTHISRFSFSLLSRFILIFRIVVTCRRQVSFICPRISAIFRRRSRAAEAVRRVYERAAANGLDHPGRPPTVTGTRPCWVTRAYPRDGASSGILRTRSRAAKPGRRVYEEDANRSGKGRSAVPSRRGFPHLAPAPRKFVEMHPARRAWPGRQKPPAVSGTRPRRVAGTRPRRVVLMRPRASGFSRSRSRSSGVGRSTHVRRVRSAVFSPGVRSSPSLPSVVPAAAACRAAGTSGIFRPRSRSSEVGRSTYEGAVAGWLVGFCYAS